MGEPGAGEISGSGLSPEISEARARLFIQSLPDEGIILHGTTARNIYSINKNGLGFQMPNFFFLSINNGDPSSFLRDRDGRLPVEYSASDTKRIMNDLKKSVAYALGYGIYHKKAAYHKNRIANFFYKKGDLPAVVIARKPFEISNIKAHRGEGLPMAVSSVVPPKNILTIVSLTAQERKQVLEKAKSKLNQYDRDNFSLEDENKVLADTILRKIVDGVIDWGNNNVRPANAVQKAMSRLLLK